MCQVVGQNIHLTLLCYYLCCLVYGDGFVSSETYPYTDNTLLLGLQQILKDGVWRENYS